MEDKTQVNQDSKLLSESQISTDNEIVTIHPKNRNICRRVTRTDVVLVLCGILCIAGIASEIIFLAQTCPEKGDLENGTETSRAKRAVGNTEPECKIEIQTNKTKFNTEHCVRESSEEEGGFRKCTSNTRILIRTECLCFGFTTGCENKRDFELKDCTEIEQHCKKYWNSNGSCNCHNKHYIRELNCECGEGKKHPRCMTEVISFACKQSNIDHRNYTECELVKGEQKCKYKNAEKSFLCEQDTNVEGLRFCNSTYILSKPNSFFGHLPENDAECDSPLDASGLGLSIAVIILQGFLGIVYFVVRYAVRKRNNREKYLLYLAVLTIILDVAVAFVAGMLITNENKTIKVVFPICSFFVVCALMLAMIESVHSSVRHYIRTTCRHVDQNDMSL